MTGDLRPTYDILTDLKPAWDNMTKSEQVALGTTLAGTNQYKIFSAVMSQMGVAQEAYAQALNSSGETMRQNEKYMDGMEAHLQALKAEFEELVLGDGGLQALGKTFIDIGTAILKFANSDLGQLIIKATLLITTMALMNKAFTSIKTSIIASGQAIVMESAAYKLMSVEAQEAALANVGFADSLKLITKAWITSPLGMATIAVAGIVGIITIVDALNVSFKEHAENLENLSQEYEQAKQKVSETKTKLSQVRDEIAEINKLNGAKVTRKGELAELQREETKLREILTLEQARAEEAKKAYAVEARQTLNAGVENPYRVHYEQQVVGRAPIGRIYNETTSPATLVKDVTDEMIKQAKVIQDTQAEFDKLDYKFRNGQAMTQDEMNTYNELLAKRRDAVGEYDKAFALVNDSETNYIDTLQNIVDNTQESSAEYKEAYDAISYFNSGLEQTSKVATMSADTTRETQQALGDLEEEADSTEDTVEELEKSVQKLAEKLGISATQLKKLQIIFGDDSKLQAFLESMQDVKDKFDGASDAIDNIQTAYSVATQAQQEYEENNKLTLDTFQSLLSISPQYLSALAAQDGKIKVNKRTLKQLVETLKIAKIEELQNAAALDIMAYASGDVDSMSTMAKNAVSGLADNMKTAGQDATTATEGLLNFAAGVSAILQAQEQDIDTSQEWAENIIKSYKKMATQISNIKVGLGKKSILGDDGSGTGGGGRPTATQEEKDANKAKYDRAKAALEHRLKMEKITEQQYYEELEKLDKKYLSNTKAHRKKYLEERRKNQEDIYEYIQKRDKKLYDDAKDQLDHQLAMDEISEKEYYQRLENIENKYLKNSKKNRKKYAEEIRKIDEDLLEGKRKVYEDESEKAERAADDAIEAYRKRSEAELKILEGRIDEIEKSYNDQIDALKDLKDSTTNYYDIQLKALEKETTERNRNITLMEKEQALMKAQATKKMVFKDGRFQYVSDETAVSSARQALAETVESQRRDIQKEGIQELKDYQIELIDKEIEYFEKAKDENVAYLNSVIDAQRAVVEQGTENIEEWKETFLKALSDMADAPNTPWNTMTQTVQQLPTLISQKLGEILSPNFVGVTPMTASASSSPVGVVQLSANAPTNMTVQPSALSGFALSSYTMPTVTERAIYDNSGVNITIGEVTLPEVKDANDFINSLQNFSIDMTQVAYSN